MGRPVDAPADLAIPHHYLPAHDRADRPALHFVAVIGRPAAAAFNPVVGDGAASFQVDHREIGVIAHGDAALAGDLEQARRAVTGHVDEPFDGEVTLVHMVEHDWNQGLNTRHSRWRLRVGLFLLGESMGGMIGAEHVKQTRAHGLPQSCPMEAIAHGRVHLGSRAEPPVGLRRREGEMMRGNFARSQIPVGGEHRQFIGGRDMQYVNAFSGKTRQPQQSLGGKPCRLGIAPPQDGWKGRPASVHPFWREAGVHLRE